MQSQALEHEVGDLHAALRLAVPSVADPAIAELGGWLAERLPERDRDDLQLKLYALALGSDERHPPPRALSFAGRHRLVHDAALARRVLAGARAPLGPVPPRFVIDAPHFALPADGGVRALAPFAVSSGLVYVADPDRPTIRDRAGVARLFGAAPGDWQARAQVIGGRVVAVVAEHRAHVGASHWCRAWGALVEIGERGELGIFDAAAGPSPIADGLAAGTHWVCVRAVGDAIVAISVDLRSPHEPR